MCAYTYMGTGVWVWDETVDYIGFFFYSAASQGTLVLIIVGSTPSSKDTVHNCRDVAL